MKSIEEKAKAYDEVREKIAIRFGSNVADEIFSQFEMSEDERIRKALINFLKSPFVNESITDEKVTPWIAWLEKQSKTSPILSNSLNTGKNTWSEEDEERLKSIISLMKSNRAVDPFYDKMCLENWLKSLKDRVQLQPKKEWSAEDKKILDDIIDSGKHACFLTVKQTEWLETLRPQNKTYYWTENEIKFAISDYIRGAESYEKMVEKLRCLKPQSRWKPSEEQMKALLNMRFAVERFGPSASLAALDDLYEQLKKL